MTLIENQSSLLAAILLMKRGCDIIPLGFNKTDIPLLQKYSPQKVELQLVNTFKDIEHLAKDKIIVSGQTFDHYQKYDTSLVIVRPLIAYDETRVREELEYFQKI